MAVTLYNSISAVSVSTSEISILTGTTTLTDSTDAGIYRLWLDVGSASLAKGDEFIVKIKEKCLSGGTQRILDQRIISHADGNIAVFPPVMLIHGWNMTIQKLSGTDRNWTAAIRKSGSCTQSHSLSAVSISTTEISIVTGTAAPQANTTEGVYQVFIDGITSAVAKSDQFRFRCMEKVLSAGTQREVFPVEIYGAQSEMVYTPMMDLKEGWDVTLDKLAGTDRSFTASIRKAA